ncbi:ABC transporter ATP-binding protein [Sinanaerobacter chloroacetimidivorans]|uniref:ABC transporter ATP-binding protein n=1 Tax=Sinanaerobacter chloroacetimidivorans TaxID=2818044 RepID=A0A8J7W133_9FIRM|nr:ABC transporter ATP-binding protein [Sinanaerobacter chloroacetimidivorans]MBR0597005.1 ABC transporter ATP-binding protein [Sinanaerobacter chloroacetimidivorans]
MFKILKNLKPFSTMIFFILLFIFGQAMAELALPTLMSDVVNNGMMQGDTGYILTYGGYMLLVALGSSLCSIIGAFFSAKVALGVGKNLRDMVFTRVENYSLHEFDKLGTASLITRTTNDIVQIQTVLVMMLRFMIYAPVMCIGGIVMAVSRDKGLTVILLVVIPVLLAFMGAVSLAVMPLFKSMQKKLDRLNMVLRENLTGIRVIRAFNKLNHEHNRFKDANGDLTNTAIKANQTMAVIQPVMMLLLNVTSIAITWFGGWRIAQNNMQIGDMMAFIQYAMQIMFSFVMVAVMFVMIPRAQASAERVNEVLEMEPEILDPEERRPSGGKTGFVAFENVSFYYPGAEQPALSNITFEAGPGEVTAIIGGTGSGKSTLINMIPRFYDASQGAVFVDSINVKDFSQEELRNKIGFVPQSAVLFSGSITENLSYGKMNATEEEICHAAEIAQASDFIADMPDGFDTIIAQGGTNVSGGQKQRLSIARALVRKPEIYIFDDSFSALDFKTDAKLRAALKNETGNAAVIIVAQRVSTVMDADQILVLDDGELVGMGTHKELLQSCQVYREIVSSQLSEEEMNTYE